MGQVTKVRHTLYKSFQNFFGIQSLLHTRWGPNCFIIPVCVTKKFNSSRLISFNTICFFIFVTAFYLCQSVVLITIHYSDIIMVMIASQITSLMIVYSTFYSGTDQRKHQSSASLPFVRGIHRLLWQINLMGALTFWYMFLIHFFLKINRDLQIVCYLCGER